MVIAALLRMSRGHVFLFCLLVAALIASVLPPGASARSTVANQRFTVRSFNANGEGYVILLPDGWRGDASTVGVLYLHGAGMNAQQALGLDPRGQLVFPAIQSLLSFVASAGLPVLSIDAGGQAWGNDQALHAIDAATDYLWNTVKAKPKTVVVIGASMGAQVGMAWVAAHRAEARAFVGLIPVCDLADVYDNDRGSVTAAVDAAYGGHYDQALQGPIRDPLVIASQGGYRGLRYDAWYGGEDDVTTPTSVRQLVAAIGPTAHAHAVEGSHATALDQIPIAEVGAFVTTAARPAGGVDPRSIAAVILGLVVVVGLTFVIVARGRRTGVVPNLR